METLPAHARSNAVAPFQRMAADAAGVNHAVVAVEQERAIAEVQGMITVAKRLPRDTISCKLEAIDVCKDLDLAQVAFYSLPRGDESIEGPTIKLAEELARVWGNIDYGHKELSRNGDQSVVEVYAWDMQTNAYSRRQMTVRHVIDLSGGRQRPCRSEKEIDDLTARKASSMLRGRILAVLPKALVNAAIAQCRETLKVGDGKPLEKRIEGMVAKFGEIGVTQDMLIKRLGHPLDKTTADELVEMIGVFTSIKENHFSVEDQFPADGGTEAVDDEKAGAQAILAQQKAAVDQGNGPAKKATPAKAKNRPVDTASDGPSQTREQPPQDNAGSNPAQNAGTVAKEQADAPRVDDAGEDNHSGNNEGDVF